MIESGRVAKILLIDSNVYFAKRLSDALKREGFEVLSSTQPAFALTTLEYDTPTAIVCATNMREMGALEIAKIIHADPKNASLPIIALGDGSQRALMEAFQAGCDDYIDRQRQPAVIATHIRNIIISKAEGFQPTQMIAQADTSLSGSLSHHDLPGVLQMLGHARQTGALHINAAAADAVLFFDAGTITHAECGNLFGDEAVIHIVKSCVAGGAGVYKFVYGTTSAQHTVLRSATDLMLDAMREYDESADNEANADSNTNAANDENANNDAATSEAKINAVLQELVNENTAPANSLAENLAAENPETENPAITDSGDINLANASLPSDGQPREDHGVEHSEHAADATHHDSLEQYPHADALANDRFAEEQLTEENHASAHLEYENRGHESSFEENREHEGSNQDPTVDANLEHGHSPEQTFALDKFEHDRFAPEQLTEDKFAEDKFADEHLADKEAL
jgi:CheY-like chemotaxis protein